MEYLIWLEYIILIAYYEKSMLWIVFWNKKKIIDKLSFFLNVKGFEMIFLAT